VTIRSLALIGAFLALPATMAAADHHDSYCRGCWQEPLIIVETKDCEGNAGLASFRAERVFKVQAGNCRDPDDSGSPLYQVMLRSLLGSGDYDIVWVDAAGMKEIKSQLEENRRSALRRRDGYRAPGRPDEEG
jgi:hypothetical protein